MANKLARGQLILQDENLGILNKGASTNGKMKILKEPNKKGAREPCRRKALNNITNSSRLWQEASSKKKVNLKEFDIAEEMCLHDHRKCIEAQITARDRYMDSAFLDHAASTLSPVASVKFKTSKADLGSPPMSLELMPTPQLTKPTACLSRGAPSILLDCPSPFQFDIHSFEFDLKPNPYD